MMAGHPGTRGCMVDQDHRSERAAGLIRDLLDAWGLAPGRPAWELLAEHIGNLARGKPYTWRYMLAIHTGNIEIGGRVIDALEKALAIYDGDSRFLVTSQQMLVYSHNPISGSYVMNGPRRCQNCGMRFVPNVPWRKNCPVCSPPGRRTR